MARSKSMPVVPLSLKPVRPTTKHKLFRPPNASTLPFRIAVAGAGGTGSLMISHLARIHTSLRAFGSPGLDVVLYDDDKVSQSNVGRQRFYPAEVGLYKSIALIGRANIGFGLAWRARPERYRGQWEPGQHLPLDMLITCVDTASARREIFDLACDDRDGVPVYWLDLGNEATTGQAHIGNFPGIPVPGGRMLTIVEQFPEFFDGSRPESSVASCSLVEALLVQDLFVNDVVALYGAKLLWDLLRHREIEWQSYWSNVQTGMTRRMPIALAGKSAVKQLTVSK